eukprot:CCRYP_015144-RB/>CCRYP_015144-RB protein AED:0.35 eAED:0.43 QI:929/0/0.5/1/0/0/2/0/83
MKINRFHEKSHMTFFREPLLLLRICCFHTSSLKTLPSDSGINTAQSDQLNACSVVSLKVLNGGSQPSAYTTGTAPAERTSANL